MAKQILFALLSLVICPDPLHAIKNEIVSRSALPMRTGIDSFITNGRQGMMRRSLCAHVEPISLSQSLIGLPVGTIAGIVGSMLGVGGGVIMVLNWILSTL